MRTTMLLDTRIEVTFKSGSIISGEVWATIDECREHYGEISPMNLERYGLEAGLAREVYELHLRVKADPQQRGNRAWWASKPWWDRPLSSYAARTVRMSDPIRRTKLRCGCAIGTHGTGVDPSYCWRIDEPSKY